MRPTQQGPRGGEERGVLGKEEAVHWPQQQEQLVRCRDGGRKVRRIQTLLGSGVGQREGKGQVLQLQADCLNV